VAILREDWYISWAVLTKYVSRCKYLDSKHSQRIKTSVLQLGLQQISTRFTGVLIHSLYATHQTLDPKSAWEERTENIDVDTKYNFILYSILQYMQLYFNYTPTVFYLQIEFNQLIFVNTANFVITLDNSNLKHRRIWGQ